MEEILRGAIEAGRMAALVEAEEEELEEPVDEDWHLAWVDDQRWM